MFPTELMENPAALVCEPGLGLPHIVQTMLAKTFLQATAGGCVLFSHCFDGMLERDRQEGGIHFPTTGACRLFMSVWITFSAIFISKWERMGRMLAAGSPSEGAASESQDSVHFMGGLSSLVQDNRFCCVW